MPVSTSYAARLKRAGLAIDAWFDSALYETGRRLAAGWDRYAERIDRLGFTGTPRVVLDLASESVTLGAAGLVVLLALAQPAFHETGDGWLKQQDLSVTFQDRYGQEIGRRGIRHDDSVKLEEFPDTLIRAALATEDRRFYDHWGIDPIGTLRALTANARDGGVVQGGSSITQQLAKNLFLSNERTLERKIKEAFLAIWLEFRLSKDEILKLYLDRAYMGGGAFGAAAAAEYYFGKSVKDLTLAESAMMAGLFKAPTKYAPHINLPAARARANDVLSNMVEAGFLTEGQVQTARRNPATAIDRGRETTPDFYLDWAFERVRSMAAAGKLGQDRVLTVKTPFDANLQRRAEQTLENLLRQHGRQYDVSQAATVLTETDGAVRAIVGGRDYGVSQFNRATDAIRQPGSSFKPFVYAAALTARPSLRPNSTIVDTPICLGNWCPQNYGRSFSGAMPLTTALARSINTVPVKMSRDEIGNGDAKRGRQAIITLAKRMGLVHPLTDSSSLPIGAAEVTVMDMTAAYGAFASGGRRVEPYAAVEIRNALGAVIYERGREAPGEEVLRPQVVADMNYMMSRVPEEGTGRRAALEGIRSAGKTGTTNGYRDAWYVGFTGNFVSAVWFGNDDYASTDNMTGGTLPAMAWKEIMVAAHQGVAIRPIPGLGDDGRRIDIASRAQPITVGIDSPPAGGSMSRRTFEIIGGIGELARRAERPRIIEISGPNGAERAAARVRATGGTTAIP